MSRLRTTATIGPAAAGLAGVLLLYLAPATVFRALPEVRAAIVGLDPSLVSLAAAVPLAGVIVVSTLRSRLGGPPTASTPARSAPDGATADRRSSLDGSDGARDRFGGGFDTLLTRALAYETRSAEERRRDRDSVVEELRAVAATAHRQSTGCSADDAAEAVQDGTWTDDAYAAGFLADEDGPTVPVRYWLVDLLLGRDPFENGVERVIRAVEDIADATPGDDRD